MISVFRERRPSDRWPLLLLYAAWLAVTLWTASHHVFYRDEVKALTMATSGATVVDMFRVLHGEGHPALWYLLLRGGYALIGKLVLPVTAFLIAAAATALLLWRAPFGWPLKALMLASKFMLFEYVVMARNYGISMLLMFSFAALYPRWRTRGIGLGLILMLLANTNVPAALLAGALMLYWIIDLTAERGWGWQSSLQLLAANAVLLMLGLALCFATVWPPFNDAATAVTPPGVIDIAAVLLLPGLSFPVLVPPDLFSPDLSKPIQALMITVLMAAILLGFVRRPAAMIAGATGLIGLALFFATVYAGSYRHEALWIVLITTLYWLARDRQLDRAAAAAGPVAPGDRRRWAVGVGALALLLALQAWLGVQTVANELRYARSGARALGILVARTPGLRNATIIADPDFLIESLPYYMGNRVEQLRRHSAIPIVPFTHKAKLSLSLDDILSAARQLNRERRAPVVILLANPVDPAFPAQTVREGYNWIYSSTPESSQRFLVATQRLPSLGPVKGIEAYNAYVLSD